MSSGTTRLVFKILEKLRGLLQPRLVLSRLRGLFGPLDLSTTGSEVRDPKYTVVTSMRKGIMWKGGGSGRHYTSLTSVGVLYAGG